MSTAVADFNYYRRPGDVPVEEARAILTTAPRRLGPSQELEIEHDGEWWKVSRTDLKDDVASCLQATYTADEWLVHYLANILYGGRFYRDGNHRRFSVIAACSDG